MNFPIKNIVLLLGLTVLSINCKSTKETLDISKEEKAIFNQVETENDAIDKEDTEYEITVIDSGFDTWFRSIAKPKGYYSQSYMESRNIIYVIEWNQRVLQPNIYDPSLYEQQIDYKSGIDYGYDVNYQLYNYFIYFQRKYKQRLGAFVPRI